jgi:hypothetical protein
MASNKDIIKQLRATANASRMYRDKWLSDDNWIELIKDHHKDSTLTSQALNRALATDHSTKEVVDIKDGASNSTGIFRDKKQVQKAGKKCRVSYYCLTVPGSSAASWDGGHAMTTQKIAAEEDVEEEGAEEDEDAIEEEATEEAEEATAEEVEEEAIEAVGEEVEGEAIEAVGEEVEGSD